MAKALKPGDSVSWKSHGGVAHGKMVRKLTRPMKIKGHKVTASPANPEFLVETGEGKPAAHRPDALRRG